MNEPAHLHALGLADPAARAVRGDWHLDHGQRLRLGWLAYLGVVTAAAAADADADAAADADADDAADDDAAAAADAAADAVRLSRRLTQECDMHAGLTLLQVAGRYWAVTRVGWLVHLGGDEWELRGATTVVRTGARRTLDSLAADGPGDDHQCSAPSKVPEFLHRFLARRPMPASEAEWVAYVGPKPEALR